jgi:hypothetical protein
MEPLRGCNLCLIKVTREEIMIEQFQLIDDSCGVGWYQHVYLTAWWDEATVARLEAVRAHRRQFLEKYPGALYSISLLFQTKLKIMTKEARQVVEQIVTDGGGRFLAEAYYVKTGGLLLTSMRLVLTGTRLLNKMKAPLEIFNNQAEAARWIASHSKLEEKNLITASEQFVSLCGK